MMPRLGTAFAFLIALLGAAPTFGQSGRDPESLWYMPSGLFLPDNQARLYGQVTLEEDFEGWPDAIEITEHYEPYSGGSVGMVEFRTIRPRPLILYCGGSAFRTTMPMAQMVARLLHYGDVIVMDYPGFGRTGGRFRRSRFVDAAEAAARHARRRADEEGRPLVLWGMSVGAMVCPFAADAAGGADLVVLETPSIRHSSVRDPRRVPHFQVAALEGLADAAIVLIASRDVEPVSAYEQLASDLSAVGVDATAQVYQTDHGEVLFHPDLQARLMPVFDTLMDRDGVD